MEAVNAEIGPRGSGQEGAMIAHADMGGEGQNLPRGADGEAIIDHQQIGDRAFSWSIQDLRLEDDDGDNEGNVGDENDDNELEASNHLGQIDNGQVKSH